MDKKDKNFLANIHGEQYNVNKQSQQRFSTSSGIKSTNSKIDIENLPYNHFTPSWARTFDFKKMSEVPASAGKQLLFEFVVPKGNTMIWTHYGLFNDAYLIDLSYFEVTVNGNRVLRYHGDPSNDFKLSLGGNASLDESALIEANITLKPNDVVRWYVINDDSVIVTMGVRMKGFIDSSNRIQASRFGG